MAQLSAQKAFNTLPPHQQENIMPIVKDTFNSQSSIRALSEIYHNIKEGNTDLSPSYQRPSVWTQQQKVNLIYSLLHHIPIPAITINARWEANQDMDAPFLEAVIDGKQRLEAIVDFLEDRLAVPTEWFYFSYLADPSFDEPTVTYNQLHHTARRVIKRTPIPVIYARFKTEAEEAEHYLRVNTAGTEQTEADLDTARSVAQGK